MTKMKWSAFAVLLIFAFASYVAVAQDAARAPERPKVQSEPAQFPEGIHTQRGTVITPPISDPHRQGVHTNYKIFIPEGQHGISAGIPQNTFIENPASLACLYKVGATYSGCYSGGFPGRSGGGVGGWGAIAVVDAYDHPFVANDLNTFIATFGLPAVTFTKVIANSSFGTLGGGFGPSINASCSGTPANANLFGWDFEIDLDTQYAHAMAPNAKIILVEACTQNLEDLLYAEEVAGIEVANAGGGDISNSWGYPEACAQSAGCNGGWGGTMFQDDNFFYRYYPFNITYFASAGDIGAEVLYPSSSPWVVSAGGTTINRKSTGAFMNESCWADSGGGTSAVESYASPPSILAGMGPWSAYQFPLFGTGNRSTPDIAADADPASGVAVYIGDEGSSNGFYEVGGTSVSSPVLAGIINDSNNRLGQGDFYYATEENNLLYSQLFTTTAYKANFYDVKLGSNGHAAGAGYDQCTGIGSPRGKLGK